MMPDQTPIRRGNRRAGFTLIELLIAMVLGLVVLTISANFASATLRSSRATDMRDGLNRDARFVGLSVARDVQDAGVSLPSTSTFGAVATRGDTVVALSVPYLPNQAEVYRMVVPVASIDPLPPGGTCGATCIDLVDPNVVPFQLRVGDLALLQVQNVRRLIVLTAVSTPVAGQRRITWSTADSLFVWPAGLTGGLRLTRTTVAVQRLQATGYYHNTLASTLMRADGFTTTGQLNAGPAARGVLTFSTRLAFTDGNERIAADGFDADTLNDYDRIMSVVVRARMKIERTDRTINGGAVLYRNYEWKVTPRNLLFERNRLL
ncbi:MAG: prepilin-type N-terminal cleavage/methylation domain-containing protein [Gemmatimonadaceae bacterium]|nr:prepilin-type N-terminal cleavage/methylation domain-containing protein [Gemmatimonadaceae bacterium]